MKEEEQIEIDGEVREEIGMKTYLRGPMDHKNTLKLPFRVGTGTCQKERGIPVVERRRKMMHRCALVAKQWRVKLTLPENVKCTRRNGTSSRK